MLLPGPLPTEQQPYAAPRLFIKTTDEPTATAYPWTEVYQDEAGVFVDAPSGRTGTDTDTPAYMADGATSVPTGTICEAVAHYGGWLIAWPVRGKGSYNLGVTLEEITGAIAGSPGAGLAMYVKYALDGGTPVHTLTGIITRVYNDCPTPIATGRLVDILREPFSGFENARDRCAFTSPPPEDTCPLAPPPDPVCLTIEGTSGDVTVQLSQSAIGACRWVSSGIELLFEDAVFGVLDLYTYGTEFYYDLATTKWKAVVTVTYPSGGSAYQYAGYYETASSWDGTSTLTLNFVEGIPFSTTVPWPATITVDDGACASDPYGSGCADAATISNAGLPVTVDMGAGEVWMKFAVENGPTYMLSLEQTSGTAGDIYVYTGACPDSLVQLIHTDGTLYCVTTTPSYDGYMYIRLIAVDSSEFSVTVEEGGTCP